MPQTFSHAHACAHRYKNSFLLSRSHTHTHTHSLSLANAFTSLTRRDMFVAATLYEASNKAQVIDGLYAFGYALERGSHLDNTNYNPFRGVSAPTLILHSSLHGHSQHCTHLILLFTQPSENGRTFSRL